MAKIISYDRNFIYIDEGSTIIEVKRNMITFDPVPGSEVIIHRNRNKEITQIELVSKIKEIPTPILEEPTVELELEEEVVEDVIEEIFEDDDDITFLVAQPTRHSNRYIEILLGFLTILIIDGIFIAFAPFLSNLINIIIFSSSIAVALIYTLLALFLKPKRARFGLFSVIIILFILLFIASIGLMFFESWLMKIQLIANFYNRFPLLAFAGQGLQIFSIIPAILGVKYWVSGKDYLKQ